MKQHVIPIAETYINHWTVGDALRELFANALDAAEYDYDKVGAEYVHTSLTISNPTEERMPISTLILGASTKQDDSNHIGQFGEGLKLAMVVLLREKIQVQIVNDDVVWRPRFDTVPEWEDTEVLVIEETPTKKTGHVTVVLSGVSEREVREAEEILLEKHRDPLWPTVESEYGEIFLSEETAGRIYVGGMLVSVDGYNRYGLNIKPKYATLSRDRDALPDSEIYAAYKDLAIALGVRASDENNYTQHLVHMCKEGHYGKRLAEDLAGSPAIAQMTEGLRELMESEEYLFARSDTQETILSKLNPSKQVVILSDVEFYLLEKTRAEMIDAGQNPEDKSFNAQVGQSSPQRVMPDLLEEFKAMRKEEASEKEWEEFQQKLEKLSVLAKHCWFSWHG